MVLEDLHLRLQAGAHGFIKNPDEEYNEYVDTWELQGPATRGQKQQPAEWVMRRIATHVNDIITEKQIPQKKSRADA